MSALYVSSKIVQICFIADVTKSFTMHISFLWPCFFAWRIFHAAWVLPQTEAKRQGGTGGQRESSRGTVTLAVSCRHLFHRGRDSQGPPHLHCSHSGCYTDRAASLLMQGLFSALDLSHVTSLWPSCQHCRTHSAFLHWYNIGPTFYLCIPLPVVSSLHGSWSCGDFYSSWPYVKMKETIFMNLAQHICWYFLFVYIYLILINLLEEFVPNNTPHGWLSAQLLMQL